MRRLLTALGVLGVVAGLIFASGIPAAATAVGVSTDTGWQSADSYTGAHNVTNPDNAYTSSYATFIDGSYVQYDDFDLTYSFGGDIPSNATITAIQVQLVARYSNNSSPSHSYFTVALSYAGSGSGGSSWSSNQDSANFPYNSGNYTTLTVGSASSLTGWGPHSWVPSNFDDNTFWVKLTSTISSNSLYLDQINVKVFYTVNPPSMSPLGGTLANWDAGLSGYSAGITGTLGGATGWASPRWTNPGGGLPPGLSLTDTSSTTCHITGTPSVGDAGNTYTFNIKVTDNLGGYDQESFSITINPLISIDTNATLPAGEVTVPYTTTLSASGGSGVGYTNWLVTAGSLPAGLTLHAATGVIDGTPTAAGNASFTVTVADSLGGTGSKAFTLNVIAAPVITETTLPLGEVTVPYTTTLHATGGTGTYTNWQVTVGSLPAGLTIAPSGNNGVISGTPTAAGNPTFTVTVTDSNGGYGTQVLSLQINAVPVITTTSLPPGEKTVPYSQPIATTGGTTPFTWSISAGALPPGIGINTSTGLISGTPTTSGIFNFTVHLQDSFNVVATQALSITIGPYITTTSLPNADFGSPYNQTLTVVAGTPPYTWSIIAGMLPPGLSMSTGGVITGTPYQYGYFVFTVKVTDSLGSPYSPQSDSRTLSITINGAILTVTSPNGGENWAIGSTHNITWTSTGAPVGALINIALSRDGGLTWTTISWSNYNGYNVGGSWSWKVTGPQTTNALIKVTAVFNGYIYDVSDATFTISAPP